MIGPTPEYWYRYVQDRLQGGEEAIFLSCTNLRVIETIQRMEDDFGIPVVASNQAAVWYALRRIGIPDQIPNYGRLLAGTFGLSD
jgi:maleate isomerase